jgi:cell division protein FtsA
VLSPEEKNLGVALVEFGGGTTDLVIFSHNSIRHTAVLALGGQNMTNDLAIGLRTSAKNAEEIKCKHGCCLTSMVDDQDMVEVMPVGSQASRTVSRKLVADILEPRVEEIFLLIHHEMIRAGYENEVPSGIVISGGSALLEGVPEVAEQVFNLPVRRGYPMEVGGLKDVVHSPQYATAVGLVIFGVKQEKSQVEKHFRIRQENIFNRVAQRMRKWFRDVI